MKRKLFLIFALICPFFVNACSCDRFDMKTYESAVRNYNNSTGIEYNLTVTEYTEGSNKYLLEESENKFVFSTTKVVLNFASTLKKYEVVSNDFGANSAPQKVYELNRYYKEETGKFYTNEIGQNIDNKVTEGITYEDKYTENDAYHLNNLVPVFKSENISNFSIVKDENNKGYSIATFTAACPSVAECDEDKEMITYKVTMNKQFYFDKIEFTTVFENKTRTYEYKFLNYNSDVNIVFPNDLVNY